MPKAKSDKVSKKAAPKRAAKAKKDPAEPKRALSAFMLFSQDHRAQIKEENPDMKFGDIGRELGARWKAATKAEKDKYKEKEIAAKSAYQAALEEYNKNKGKEEEDEEEEDDDDEEDE